MESESSEPAPARRPGMHGVDLTTGSVPWHMVRFSIPMLMGSALQTSYSIINAAWVGRGLGANAMAALTVSFPIFFMLVAVAGGLTLASSILVSQAYGAKDMVRLRLVVQNSMVLTGMVAIVCLVTGQLAAESVLRAMSTPPEVLPMAVSYFRLYLWTTPFMFGGAFISSAMRGVGDSRSPLYFQAVALVCTAILDPLLMFGLLGLPRLGLNGTAVATLLSHAGAFVSLAVYVQLREHIAAPDWRRLKLHLPTTILTAKIGIPTMIQQALVSLGMLFVVSMINRYGAHSSAAFGIAMRIDQLAFIPAMTVGMAVSTLAGQNIGAGRFERVHEVFWWGVALSCAITAVASILALSLPSQLIGLFSNDADVIAVGTQYLRIVGLGYLLFAVMFVSNGVINGSGQTGITTVFTFITFWAVRVPLAAYLSHHLGRVEGIWYAVLASLVVGTIASLSYYLSGRWKKSLVRDIPQDVLAPTPEID